MLGAATVGVGVLGFGAGFVADVRGGAVVVAAVLPVGRAVVLAPAVPVAGVGVPGLDVVCVGLDVVVATGGLVAVFEAAGAPVVGTARAAGAVVDTDTAGVGAAEMNPEAVVAMTALGGRPAADAADPTTWEDDAAGDVGALVALFVDGVASTPVNVGAAELLMAAVVADPLGVPPRDRPATTKITPTSTAVSITMKITRRSQ